MYSQLMMHGQKNIKLYYYIFEFLLGIIYILFHGSQTFNMHSKCK